MSENLQDDLFGFQRFGIETQPEINADLIVVPVSGGKDSQACLKLAVATGKKVFGMFNDTKFEHPLTYQQILRWGRFPGMQHRFCTKNLKVRPSKRFYKKFAEQHGGFEVWIGVRKDESAARKKRYAGCVGEELVAPNDFMEEYPKFLQKMGVMFRLPVIDWSEKDVFEYLDGQENPLYSHGSKRVGCYPCLAAGDDQMIDAFSHDDFGRNQWRKVQFLQEKTGHSALRGEVGGNGCSICSM